MDHVKRTRKNDTIDSAQNAPTHSPKQKKVQEEDAKQQKEEKEVEKDKQPETEKSEGEAEDESHKAPETKQ